MVLHFAVKLELNKGANKMGIFGKGGYDSPENEKRREKKEAVEKKEKKEKRPSKVIATTGYKEDLKKFITEEVPETAKNTKKAFRRAFFKTPAEKKEDKETKKAFIKQMEKNRLKKSLERQKNIKAKKAGAPDGKVIRQNKAPLYIHDAVKRANDKKIKPSSLKSKLSDKKVVKVMTDQVDAMKKQAEKRSAKEEGIGSFKAGGPIMDRNYLKGR